MNGTKGLFPSLKKILLTAVLALLASLFLKSVFDETGLIRGKKLKAECEAKLLEVQRLEMENQLLRDEIYELQKPTSRRLEILGRSEFGMVKPGEVVFSFPVTKDETTQLD